MNDVYEYDIGTDSWKTESSNLPRRMEHSCISIDGGSKILIVGGHYGNSTVKEFYSTTVIYDTESKNWSYGPSFPTGFYASSMVQASPNSQYVAYILGGSNILNDIYGITKDLQNVVKVGDLKIGRGVHKAIKLPTKVSEKCQQP